MNFFVRNVNGLKVAFTIKNIMLQKCSLWPNYSDKKNKDLMPSKTTMIKHKPNNKNLNNVDVFSK